ncbi:MAG: hypothetical protein GX427_04705 [Actinomycetales bacterium]|nr:hypothetical protein [Actinomycetales bacterium]
MPAADGPFPYAWWVLALGVALVVAALAWVAYVLLRRAPGDGSPEARDVSWGSRVDLLHDRFRRGEIDLRVLHLELARLIREAGSERVGRDITWMSRAEVAETFPRTGLGPLLARYEDPSFSRDPRAEAETTIRMTREVLARW